MALVLKDRVKETSTTTGTGSLTLLGASTGYQTFSSAIGNTNTTYYTIQNAGEWEVGIGTVSAGALSRDTVLASSTGAKVSLSAGTKDVFCTYPAGKSVYADASGYVSGYTIENSPIGATTPSTGKFTSVTTPSVTATTDNLTLSAISTGAINFNTLNGTAFKIVDTGSSATNYWRALANGAAAIFRSLDSVANAQIQTNGTGSVLLGTNAGVTQAAISHTASAVNYVQVTGAATTAAPTISAQGSDTNIALSFVSKGTARHNFFNNGATSSRQFAIGTSGITTAVNFLNVDGSVSGIALPMQAQGTDTNISMAFQTKGTGAIDLAAGSSGVNISNGNTVTAITRTGAGTGYTSPPTVAITAPTTAGGVQATASSFLQLATTATITSGGTGYTVGDTLTFVGGTIGVGANASQLTVTSVSAGVITGVSILTFGTGYSAVPTSPISVTGGTGTGATFTVTGWQIATFTITNAGSGYIEQPTVTFSGGGGSGAAAYATVGGTTTIKSIGHTGTVAMRFDVPSSLPNNIPALRLIDASAGQDSGMQIIGAVGGAVMNAFGATNAYTGLFSSGTGQVKLGSGGTSQTLQLNVSHTASAVNYVQVTGAATGGNPAITVQGSDATRGLAFSAKGNANINFFNNNLTNNIFVISGNAGTIANYLQATASVAGTAVSLQAQGTDTNIDLALTPKGTGVVKANGSALSAENGIILNKQTVAANVSVSSGYSAHSAGPVTVSSGVSVTIASGSRWVVI